MKVIEDQTLTETRDAVKVAAVEMNASVVNKMVQQSIWYLVPRWSKWLGISGEITMSMMKFMVKVMDIAAVVGVTAEVVMVRMWRKGSVSVRLNERLIQRDS